jgi:MFS family permease
LNSILDTGRTPKELFAFSIIRPLKMLLLPIVFLQSLYVAIVYSYLYIMFTTFPIVFGDQYNFGSGPSGLATLGIAVGSVIGSGACGAVMDRLSNYLAAKHGGDRKPEYRLPVMTIGGLLVPAGLFMYAWTAENKTHWIAPIIGSGILACGLNIVFMASTMYLVDEYHHYAASVTAAMVIVRCFLGSFLPLAGPALYDALGFGWGSSLLGFIALAFLPMPLLFYRYGEHIRETRLFPVDI